MNPDTITEEHREFWERTARHLLREVKGVQSLTVPQIVQLVILLRSARANVGAVAYTGRPELSVVNE